MAGSSVNPRAFALCGLYYVLCKCVGALQRPCCGVGPFVHPRCPPSMGRVRVRRPRGIGGGGDLSRQLCADDRVGVCLCVCVCGVYVCVCVVVWCVSAGAAFGAVCALTSLCGFYIVCVCMRVRVCA